MGCGNEVGAWGMSGVVRRNGSLGFKKVVWNRMGLLCMCVCIYNKRSIYFLNLNIYIL